MATVRCVVTAEPDADLVFLFNGAVMDTASERFNLTISSGPQYYQTVHTLEIRDLLTSEAGMYACRANNTHGNDTSDSAPLEVLGR